MSRDFVFTVCSVISSQFDPSPQPAADPQDRMRALLEKQLGVLDQMVDAGIQIVLALPPTAPDDTNVGLSYHRVTRAVRLTQATQKQVLSDILALDQPAAA